MLPLSVSQLIDSALQEDLGYGDLTSESIFPASQTAQGIIHTRQPAVISGLGIAQAVFHRVDPALKCHPHVNNGDTVVSGDPVLTLTGAVQSILKAERTALNFLQRLCGIATLTYQFSGAISGTKAKITHTRKTTPGWRYLEVEAVLHGGGAPHRQSLSHAVLIKDNHIEACGSITQAIAKAREHIGHTVKIEVECDTLEQVDEAVSSRADVILLDNMPINTLTEAVKRIDGRATTEASGGVTLSNVLDIARTGVDIISTSQITLSAPAVDLGLDFVK